MTALSFRPEPEFMGESLVSTSRGAYDDQTLLHVGLASLKNDIRAFAYGHTDEDPLVTRRFYFPVAGALRSVSVSRVDVVVGEFGTTTVHEVRHAEPDAEGHRMEIFRFSTYISHD